MTAAAAIAAAVLALTPHQKAAMVVVTTQSPRIFTGAAQITFADQEGGTVQTIGAAPSLAARGYTSVAQALAGGQRTRAALRAAGVDVDFGPIFDTADGPLGSREFRSAAYATAFARGLGDAACAKHFPGLGSTAYSTDDRPHVDGYVRPQDLAPYRAAIKAGLGCVMVGNAFYGTRYRASLEPQTYRQLRALGFDGIAITDSLSLVRAAPVERWAPQAVRAGADMVLFTSPPQARRAIASLVPLARAGELDEHIARILRFRRVVSRR